MKNILLLLTALFGFVVGTAQDTQSSTDNQLQNNSVEFAPSNCPASPYEITISQPDNSLITIVGKGNMNNYRTESTDGYTLIRNKDGIYEYAILNAGQLVASGIKAHNPSNRSATEQNFIQSLNPSIQPPLNPLKSSILNQVKKQIQNKTYPATGSIDVLAILIDYPDLQRTYTKTDFDSLLNGLNYRNGDHSFKTFFETASHNQLTVNVDIVGWFRADSSYIWYGRDSGSTRAADLVREAVDSAELSGINFSKYDNNNDGSVDGIMAIHSGQGAESGSQTQYIWSHRWGLTGSSKGTVTYDGVLINDYIINPEIRRRNLTNHIVGIGVFCHEFGHNIGLPDLYDTDDTNGGSEGIGNWGLMGGGSWLGNGHQPANFSAWSKIQNGWDTPSHLTIGLHNGTYMLNPASKNKDEIYRINTTSSTEYFLLENRQKTGLDTALPGSGMAIWKINTAKTNSFGNGVNGDETDKGVGLNEADGSYDLDFEINRGDAGDLFPGSSNNTLFNDTTNPASILNGLVPSGLKISAIVENQNQINFYFGNPSITACGNDTLTAPADTISDNSGDNNLYDNNLACSWLIQPPGAQSISLNFLKFRTVSGEDSITVYDGSNNSAPVLGSFSGTNIPPNVNSTSAAMFVEFYTDGNTVDSGFTAIYTATLDTIDILKDTLILNAALNSLDSFDLKANTNWSLSTGAAWLTINPKNGSNDTTVKCTANQENTGLERYAKVYAVNDKSEIVDSLFLIQNGIPPALSANPKNIYLNSTANSKATVKVKSNLNWSISNPAAWLSLNKSSGSKNGNFEVTATSTNITTATRTDTLTLSANGIADQFVIVNQLSEVDTTLGLSKDTVYLDSDRSSEATFYLSTNAVNWNLNENANWLQLNPTIGDSTQKITAIATQKNRTANYRFTTVTASASNFNDSTVVVAQRPSSLLFKISEKDVLVGGDSGSVSTFNISSNLAEWNIKNDSSWISVSPTKGSFTQLIKVTAVEDNKTGSKRSSVLEISAPPAVPKSVTATQDTIWTIGLESHTLTQNINLFPNPSKGAINLMFDKEVDLSALQLKAYNNFGAKVNLTIDVLANNHLLINLNNVATGIYIVVIDYNGTRSSKRISVIAQ